MIASVWRKGVLGTLGLDQTDSSMQYNKANIFFTGKNYKRPGLEYPWNRYSFFKLS